MKSTEFECGSHELSRLFYAYFTNSATRRFLNSDIIIGHIECQYTTQSTQTFQLR